MVAADPKEAGKILDAVYEKALNGIPKVSPSVDDLANDYAGRYDSPKKAAWALCRVQIAKCGTSGFITGLGGLITLPVAVPANLGSVLYVQMRMIAAVAKMGGYDIRSDQVQTMIYMCLTGTSVTDVAKEIGAKAGEKALEVAIKRIPREALVAINQKMGFRFITKFGEKGIINLGKAVPAAGGLVGGVFDLGTTSAIAAAAIRMFIDKEEKPRKQKRFILARKKREKRDSTVDGRLDGTIGSSFGEYEASEEELALGEIEAEVIDVSSLSDIEQDEINAVSEAIGGFTDGDSGTQELMA